MRASVTPRHTARASMAQNMALLSPTSALSFPYSSMATPGRGSVAVQQQQLQLQQQLAAAATSTSSGRSTQSPFDSNASTGSSDSPSMGQGLSAMTTSAVLAAAQAAAAQAAASGPGASPRGENIQVHIRIRPAVEGHQSEAARAPDCVMAEAGGKSVALLPSLTRGGAAAGPADTKRMQFDHVFDANASQEDLATHVAPRFVDACLGGFNGTILAYGQTGSGKTFTMVGPAMDITDANSPHRGLIPRLLENLFSEMSNREKAGEVVPGLDRVKFAVQVEFVEIYNENLRDLLCTSPNPPVLDIRTLPVLHVSNLSRFPLHSYADALRLLSLGNKSRTFASTRMNEQSSRSHSVFTLHVTTTFVDSNKTMTSRLNLVDLAGSENQKSAGTSGERLKEGANINKSLSTLSQVISALSKRAGFIPYRNSKLTFLLSDSIGGNSKTTLIATISPSADHGADTLNTLNFANTAKGIKLDVQQNLQVNGNAIDPIQLQRKLERAIAENQRLKQTQAEHDDTLQAERALGAESSDAVLALLDQSRSYISAQMDATALWEVTEADARAYAQELEAHLEDLEVASAAREHHLTQSLTRAREQVAEMEQTASLSEEEAGRKVRELHAQLREQRSQAEATQEALEAALKRAENLEAQLARAEEVRLETNAAHLQEVARLTEDKSKAADLAKVELQSEKLREQRSQQAYNQALQELSAEQDLVARWSREAQRMSQELLALQQDHQTLMADRDQFARKETEWIQASTIMRQAAAKREEEMIQMEMQWADKRQSIMAEAAVAARPAVLSTNGWLEDVREDETDAEDSVVRSSSSRHNSEDVSNWAESDAVFQTMLADLCSQPLLAAANVDAENNNNHSMRSPTAAKQHQRHHQRPSQQLSTPLQERSMQASAAAQHRSPLGAFLDSASKQRRESRSAAGRKSMSPSSEAWSLLLDPVARDLDRAAAVAEAADPKHHHRGSSRRSIPPPSFTGLEPSPRAATRNSSGLLVDTTPSRQFR